MLGEVARRELGAVLERADRERDLRPGTVRTMNPRTLVRPCESIFTRTPVTGEATVADALAVSAVAGLDPHPVRVNPATRATRRHDAGESRRGPHAGGIPVPLLPGLAAGSPAAQRGQVPGPGS